MTFLGVDNGVTGSIGMVSSEGFYQYNKMPVKRELNYTKSKQWLHRVDGTGLQFILGAYEKIRICLIERPMINPGRWKATVSAIRCLEATLITLEDLNITRQYIDSREWQKALLPSGLEKEELKEASLQVGKRLFPKIDWTGFTDADGILIAEHARRTYK